jgi:hypothetical protein
MSPASGREMVMMDACGSSSNNRAMSSTRNDAEIIAARTSGHRYGAGSTSLSASDSGSRLGPDSGIHAYRWCRSTTPVSTPGSWSEALREEDGQRTGGTSVKKFGRAPECTSKGGFRVGMAMSKLVTWWFF